MEDRSGAEKFYDSSKVHAACDGFVKELKRALPEAQDRIHHLADEFSVYLMVAIYEDYKAAMSAGVKQGSKKATEGRYAARDKLLNHAAAVARDMWRRGSEKMHNDMATHLIMSYRPQHSPGTLPFKKVNRRLLMKELIKVLTAMDMTDRIKGIKRTR